MGQSAWLKISGAIKFFLWLEICPAVKKIVIFETKMNLETGYMEIIPIRSLQISGIIRLISMGLDDVHNHDKTSPEVIRVPSISEN